MASETPSLSRLSSKDENRRSGALSKAFSSVTAGNASSQAQHYKWHALRQRMESGIVVVVAVVVVVVAAGAPDQRPGHAGGARDDHDGDHEVEAKEVRRASFLRVLRDDERGHEGEPRPRLRGRGGS